jgi:hypothetical protein
MCHAKLYELIKAGKVDAYNPAGNMLVDMDSAKSYFMGTLVGRPVEQVKAGKPRKR